MCVRVCVGGGGGGGVKTEKATEMKEQSEKVMIVCIDLAVVQTRE